MYAMNLGVCRLSVDRYCVKKMFGQMRFEEWKINKKNLHCYFESSGQISAALDKYAYVFVLDFDI